MVIPGTRSAISGRVSEPLKQGFKDPSTFLTSLPKLLKRFQPKANGRRVDHPWPGFGVEETLSLPESQAETKQTEVEERLFAGIECASEVRAQASPLFSMLLLIWGYSYWINPLAPS